MCILTKVFLRAAAQNIFVQSAENSYIFVTFVTFKKLQLLQFCNHFLRFAQKMGGVRHFFMQIAKNSYNFVTYYNFVTFGMLQTCNHICAKCTKISLWNFCAKWRGASVWRERQRPVDLKALNFFKFWFSKIIFHLYSILSFLSP